MSSSPHADGEAATRGRVLAPRTWSLRVRLAVTQMVLLAVVIASIGVATEFALQRFLSHQLDEQLVEAGRRSVAIFDLPPPVFVPGTPDWEERRRFDPEVGPGPGFLNAPGQATRTVGAVVTPGRDTDAGVITADGGRSAISETATEQLAAVPPDHTPRTVTLDGLGRYRVIGLHDRRGGTQTLSLIHI